MKLVGVAAVVLGLVATSSSSALEGSALVAPKEDAATVMDGFLGALEKELKAELAELRAEPEIPFLSEYTIDDGPKIEANLDSIHNMMRFGEMQYKEQEKVVEALEKALSDAKKSQVEHDSRLERAQKTIAEADEKIKALEDSVFKLEHHKGARALELENVFNTSKKVAYDEYYSALENAKFDRDEGLSKAKIDWEIARERIEFRIDELDQEAKSLNQKLAESKAKFAAGPDQVKLDHVQENVELLARAYKANKAKKAALERKAKDAAAAESALSEEAKDVMKALQ
jgi:hypothetical protein